jgi:hypothetical protein
MSVGFSVDKATLDQRAGSLAWQIRETLRQCSGLKEWLDGKTDQDLVLLGYSPDEAAVIKSAFTDLDKLARIANGLVNQDEPNDFLFWADRLTGVQ